MSRARDILNKIAEAQAMRSGLPANIHRDRVRGLERPGDDIGHGRKLTPEQRAMKRATRVTTTAISGGIPRK